MDSLTLLVAAAALGGRPPCYTFNLGPGKSQDFDVSRRAAAHFGVLFNPVELSRDEDRLVADIVEAIRHTRTTLKTAVQCCQCMSHVFKAVLADGFREAIIGTGGIVADTKTVAMLLHNEGEEAARKHRRYDLYTTELCATNKMKEYAAALGLKLFDPYSSQPIGDYGLSLNVSEINWPKQKGIALRAFSEFFQSGAWYRPNSSLQVNSGVREWHETLLQSQHNKRGSKKIEAVYNDIAKANGLKVERAVYADQG